MIALEVVLSVLRKVWEYGRPVFLSLAVLFALLWGRGCVQSNALSLELEACKSKPPVVIEAKAKTTMRTQVIFKDKASPCPDVVVDADSEAVAGVTMTAQASTPKLGVFSISAGAGMYRGGVYPMLGGGVWWGPVGVEVQTLWPMAWEESQTTRRPVATLGLTYRP